MGSIIQRRTIKRRNKNDDLTKRTVRIQNNKNKTKLRIS